ncbi:Rod shape-determining protein RodA [Candidatus Bandiella woodruffii]|uniref:Rod shape-determining protein RodA n=2 Tax=Candidatus Bandiella euplotis TaxID=1664265 RepID=A0ABZ0UP12_9RICK|nr:Rod shape-determining protein RodA [Candidatus Bandiella woodruffii]
MIDSSLKKDYLPGLLLGLLSVLMLVSIFSMYSVSGGVVAPIVTKQLYISALSLFMMFVFSKINLKLIFRSSYDVYLVILCALVVTEFLGHIGMGAKRWINLGIINIQPSEFMKIGLILALAHYFYNCHVDSIVKTRFLLSPAILVLLPSILIMKQPNLGTAMIIISTAATIFFLAGVRVRVFVCLGVITLVSMPIIWRFLYDYQKTRVLTFLDPMHDKLGAGYNIIQSIISIGSGGVFGKGFLKGSQNQLDFLPENHTDFIFGLIAEEGGFVLCLALFLIYFAITLILYLMSVRCDFQFHRLVILGFASLLFFHVFINIGMISGLLPVVGVPLPFLSYGGSNFIAMMIGVGLVLNCYTNKKVTLKTAPSS